MSISKNLQELVNQKKALANNLVEKGVEASEEEKFNTLVPKVLDISGGLEGFEGFEEATGLAGENLTKNDVVGYFNGDPSVELLPNKSYYDNGNKYYVSGGYFYNSVDDSLLEHRTFPTNATVIRNDNSPTMDYSYTNDTTNKLITIYKWNGSEYEETTSFNYNITSPRISVKETKNCLLFVTYKKDNTTFAYILNKNTNIITTKTLGAFGGTYFLSNAIYEEDEASFIFRNNELSGNYTIYVYRYDLYTGNALISKPISVYGYNVGKIAVIGKGNKFIFNYEYTSKDYSTIDATNEYGTNRVFTLTGIGYLYFVSASKDYNEIIVYDQTYKKYYQLNVAENKVTELTDYSSSHYCNAGSYYDENCFYHVYDMTTETTKVAKMIGWGEQYKKLTSGGTSHYEHIGIVKEDCTEGNDVTVYKVSDKNLLIYNQKKSITPTKETQTITPDNGYDGLNKVTVNAIPSSYIMPSGTKEITANGSYDVTNYKTTNVNVPIPDGYIKPEGEVEIVENGVYDVTNYSSANVNIPVVEEYDGSVIIKNLITFTIGSAEYQAEEGMTWEQWVNSSYNTRSYVTKNNYVYINTNYTEKVRDSSDPVLITETITANGAYTTGSGGGIN